MTGFSLSTQNILRKAGWQPNRSVSTLTYQLVLRTEGYPWFSAVKEFLQEFGGLRVIFTYRDGSAGTLHFDVRKAASDVDAGRALNNATQRIRNSYLSIIGQTNSGHMSLYMDEVGTVYGGFDYYLCFIADSGKEAIEAICQHKPSQEIQEL